MIKIAGQENPLGQEMPPLASMLMQSLRSVGYTISAAMADLVDNSITAGAQTIRISLEPGKSAYVSVVDDGAGMDASTLLTAMRFGSRDPRDARAGNDLGRFGLGLKTASLSQCRRMTVATRRNGVLSVARWDLDICDEKQAWWLDRPHEDELPAGPLAILKSNGSGTAVIWEKLDRLKVADREKAILDSADYLALAFHRFLAGELGKPLSILLNDRPLPEIDPFLEGHSRGQSLHVETIFVDDHPVRVSPFVLPFPSKLKPTDLERAGGRDNLRTAHGFYIYRGGRLVVPGGWFRIVPSDELIRLARIRVEVPTELDHIWKVDIRKTIAEPPSALRPELKRIVGDVTKRSRKVYRHRGTAEDDSKNTPLWQRFMLAQGASWKINRDHPLVRTLSLTGGTSIESALKLLEENLPVQDIYIHASNDQLIAEAIDPDETELEAIAARMIGAFSDQPDTQIRLLDNLHFLEPFNRNHDCARRIAERLRP